MTEELTLDQSHVYRLGDRRVPGFTEICQNLGVIEPNGFYTEDGRRQGTALSDWLLFLASGKVADQEPEPEIAGRVEGIRKFLSDTKFVFVAGEVPQYDPVLNFVTRPDIWGHIGSFSCVVEAKRGAKMGFHFLQTAAEKIALAANGFQAQKRYCLYLRDGDYRLEEHANRDDERNWRAIVAAFHAKAQYT